MNDRTQLQVAAKHYDKKLKALVESLRRASKIHQVHEWDFVANAIEDERIAIRKEMAREDRLNDRVATTSRDFRNA